VDFRFDGRKDRPGAYNKPVGPRVEVAPESPATRLLVDQSFRRQDETPDTRFYGQPRFVTHIDDGAIAAVTQVYRETLPGGGSILDLMSSWISHLPPEVEYGRVVGLGMNGAELAKNSRLESFVVHDLNRNPALPFASGEFDAATLCVSIDYLTQPRLVLQDAARVVKAGGPIVITFSDRCFPTKAVFAWLSTNDTGRKRLVQDWLAETNRWEQIQVLDRGRRRPLGDPLYAVIATSRGPLPG